MSDNRNSYLATILEGVGVYTIGKVLSKLTYFIINLLLTSLLGASLYGVFSFVKTIINFSYRIGNLGTHKSILRFIPMYRSKKDRDWIFTVSLAINIFSSISISVLLYTSAPAINEISINHDFGTACIRIFSAYLPFHMITNLFIDFSRSLKKPMLQAKIQHIIVPSSRLLAVGVAFMISGSLLDVVYLWMFSGVLSFLVAVFILGSHSGVSLSTTSDKASIKKFLNISLPLTFTEIGSLLTKRVDILLIGYYLTSEVVGVYNIAAVLSDILTLPLTAVNQLFPAVSSDLYQQGDLDELENVYRAVTRWAFTLSLWMGAGLIVFRSDILGLFGQDFIIGKTVLLLFVIGQVLNASAGPSGYLLAMSGNQYVTLANQVILAILNLSFNIILIPRVGFVGAAIATAAVLGLVNMIRVVEIWVLEGVHPYSREYYKPVVSFLATVVSLIIIRSILPLFVSMIVGAIIGTIIFYSIIYSLGINELDKELIIKLS